MRRYRGKKRKKNDGRAQTNERRDAARDRRVQALRAIGERESAAVRLAKEAATSARRRVWATFREENA